MRRYLALVSSLAVLLFSACGTEDDAADPQVEAAIRKEIHGSLEHQLPVICPAMETTSRDELIYRFLSRALRYCEGGDVDEIVVRSMRIANVAVDGGTATADVAPLGGRFDGQTVTVALRRDENGEWRLDEVTSYREFDPRAAVRSFGDGLTGVSWTTAERRFGNCLDTGLKGAPASDLEALAFDPVGSPFDSVLVECASRFGWKQ